jgi:hypothetical protein
MLSAFERDVAGQEFRVVEPNIAPGELDSRKLYMSSVKMNASGHAAPRVEKLRMIYLAVRVRSLLYRLLTAVGHDDR